MDEGEIGPAAEAARWLLLIHQLPAKPAYPRVKVWRRLQALGAVTMKNSVYVLPANEQTQEDFEWLLKEIVEVGGEGLVCEARLVDGLSDEDARELFNAARATDYEAIAADARTLAAALAASPEPGLRADGKIRLSRLKANVQQLATIDFFGADGRERVEGLLQQIETMLQEESSMPERTTIQAEDGIGPLQGRVWVTRQGVHVDRIASAWLIRRFIDPEARFKFVPGKGYRPQPGELRFDMFEGEFTHEGDCCTFEVLLARMGLTDPALSAIAEIVHDIDLKDGKFGRPESPGIATLIDALAIAAADEQRIERGSAIFDDLHRYFAHPHHAR